MTTTEYVQFILEVRKETPLSPPIGETAAYEAGQLISGSFMPLLYEALWVRAFDMETVTQHLEDLYDREDHFGLIYFVFILANAADVIFPALFSAMSATNTLASMLSAAIIEDWLEYHTISIITEEDGIE